MFQFLHWHMFGKWLWDVFRHGPAFMGGWMGLADEEVCARIATNTHTADWVLAGRPSEACIAMLDRAFHAYCVPAYTLLYVACVWLCVKWALERARMNMFARRVALEIHTLQQPSSMAVKQLENITPQAANLLTICSLAHACQPRLTCS
jgi:hypothetical protein